MTADPRLERLRNKEEIIPTFTSRELIQSPEFVDAAYTDHAQTHMSLGDTSTYLERLLQWALVNRGALVGAISGDPGYGKTSTAIYLWTQLDQRGVLAVPPFTWERLQDIVDAVSYWVRYRIEKLMPQAVAQVEDIYRPYRERAIEDVAGMMSIPVSKARELADDGVINLNCSPRNVISFLQDLSGFLERSELGLGGPVVFVDELQVSMTAYVDRKRSRDEFMQDLFELVNPLIGLQGSFGIMIGMPTNTETVISSARPDIHHRLQHCNLFIRPNTMYRREFPAELWRKFAEMYEFKDIANSVLRADTLDSIGQIAFRNDLGAGPRTVVEAMRRGIDNYDKSGGPLSPVDLIDAFLNRQIAFDAGGKLVAAVREVLDSRELQQISGGDEVVKLMAAFPLGCKDAVIAEYGLAEPGDQVQKRLYTDYLYRFSEGLSLRKLAPTERGAEPRVIELTKSFIQTYSESQRDLKSAAQSFKTLVVQDRLMTPRRADQIEGWIPDNETVDGYVGTFDRHFPERHLRVRVSSDRSQLISAPKEFGLSFWFDPDCEAQFYGQISNANEEGTLALFRLNLLQRPKKPLNIPYIADLGFPLDRVTPAFMLALVDYLQSKHDSIPEDERQLQLQPFERSLIDYSVQLLLSDDLLQDAGFPGVSKVGLAMCQDVFSSMCRARYPQYETLITSGRWEKILTTYIGALQRREVASSVSIVRGNRPLELPERDALALFGETRRQPFYGLAESLRSLLEYKDGTRESGRLSLRFKPHPAEESFMDALRQSTETFTRGNVQLRALGRREGWDLLLALGYRQQEVALVLATLKARHLVDWNEKVGRFEEVLESPEERREAILAALAALTENAEILATIPDFDKERFGAKVEKLGLLVRDCSDIEELEEYQSQLSSLKQELTDFMSEWDRKIRSNFDRIRQDAGAVQGTGMPSDLTASIKGDVSWVSELTQCQVLLKTKYQQAFQAFSRVTIDVEAAINKWTASAREPRDLVELHAANSALFGLLSSARAALQAAKAYLSSYQSWPAVVNAASRAYGDAISCETSYKECSFRNALEVVFVDMTKRFQERRLEALQDHEIFTDQIQEVQSNIDTWLRGLRDHFMQAKLFYEEQLQLMGVERFNLRAGFDRFDSEASYTSLYSEVLDRLRERLAELELDLSQCSNETLYAEKILGANVAKEALKEAETAYEPIKSKVNEASVRDQDSFGALSKSVSNIVAKIAEAKTTLRGVLEKRAPTLEEESLLGRISDSRATDLSELIISTLAVERDEFSLDGLMGKMVSLFKKNQIIVRLEKRK